jgi:hypothetical protein
MSRSDDHGAPDAKGPGADPYAPHLKPLGGPTPPSPAASPDQREALQTDLRALARFLDSCLALDRPVARTRQRPEQFTQPVLQRQFRAAFPELAESQVSPAAFRTALEVAAIWSRWDYRKLKPGVDGSRLIRIASVLAWRREPRILEIYNALRSIGGDPVKLPWKVLKPLARLDGLDRQRLDGTLLVPPIVETLTALPEIQKAYAKLLRALELASVANQEIYDIRGRLGNEYAARLQATQDKDPSFTWKEIDGIAQAWYWTGDQIMDNNFFIRLSRDNSLNWSAVTNQMDLISKYLGKTKAKRLEGRPDNLEIVGDIAAEIAIEINGLIRPARIAYHEGAKGPGHYRNEVLDPTRALIHGAYGLDLSRAQLLRKIQGRKGVKNK